MNWIPSAGNPLYGQGMSVAAMEAAALRDLLAERGWRADLGSALGGESPRYSRHRGGSS